MSAIEMGSGNVFADFGLPDTQSVVLVLGCR